VRTIQTYERWLAEFMLFHHDRTWRWIHLQERAEPEVEAFLNHLSIKHRVAECTQNQALGANRLGYPQSLDSEALRPIDAAGIPWIKSPATRPHELATGFERRYHAASQGVASIPSKTGRNKSCRLNRPSER